MIMVTNLESLSQHNLGNIDFNTIYNFIHNLVLKYRNIEYLLKVPMFEKFFNTFENKPHLIHLIVTGEVAQLKEIFKKWMQSDNCRYEELRSIAVELGIPNYSTLTKEQLIHAIGTFK